MTDQAENALLYRPALDELGLECSFRRLPGKVAFWAGSDLDEGDKVYLKAQSCRNLADWFIRAAEYLEAMSDE